MFRNSYKDQVGYLKEQKDALHLEIRNLRDEIARLKHQPCVLCGKPCPNKNWCESCNPTDTPAPGIFRSRNFYIDLGSVVALGYDGWDARAHIAGGGLFVAQMSLSEYAELAKAWLESKK